ncbi:MAG: hypothetical protein OEW75_14750 [Cyclobacteriaceae bacterium]|nr:hypothetical protein [Cyclobacteriaceae bacterium]
MMKKYLIPILFLLILAGQILIFPFDNVGIGLGIILVTYPITIILAFLMSISEAKKQGEIWNRSLLVTASTLSVILLILNMIAGYSKYYKTDYEEYLFYGNLVSVVIALIVLIQNHIKYGFNRSITAKLDFVVLCFPIAMMFFLEFHAANSYLSKSSYKKIEEAFFDLRVTNDVLINTISESKLDYDTALINTVNFIYEVSEKVIEGSGGYLIHGKSTELFNGTEKRFPQSVMVNNNYFDNLSLKIERLSAIYPNSNFSSSTKELIDKNSEKTTVLEMCLFLEVLSNRLMVSMISENKK